MPGYNDSRSLVVIPYDATAQNYADDEIIAEIDLPEGKEVYIHDFRVRKIADSTATVSYELELDGTVVDTLDVSTTTANESIVGSTSVFPYRAIAAASGAVLTVRADQADTAGRGVIQITMNTPSR